MTEEKLDEILNVLEGITELEWSKLRTSVDMYFRKEASRLKIGIKLTDLDYVKRECDWYKIDATPQQSERT